MECGNTVRWGNSLQKLGFIFRGTTTEMGNGLLWCSSHVIRIAYYSNGILYSLHVIHTAYYSNGLMCSLHVIHIAYYSNGLMCSLHVIHIAYYSNGLMCSLHVIHIVWHNVSFSSMVLTFTYNKPTNDAINSMTHISSCDACSPSACQRLSTLKISKQHLQGASPHRQTFYYTLQTFLRFDSLLYVGPSLFWDVTRVI